MGYHASGLQMLELGVEPGCVDSVTPPALLLFFYPKTGFPALLLPTLGNPELSPSPSAEPSRPMFLPILMSTGLWAAPESGWAADRLHPAVTAGPLVWTPWREERKGLGGWLGWGELQVPFLCRQPAPCGPSKEQLDAGVDEPGAVMYVCTTCAPVCICVGT